MAVPVFGVIIGTALSTISVFLGLFGGSKVESQNAMLKRVVEEAIKEFRNKDMKEDVEGLQQVYQSISSSIQQFRRSKNLEKSQAELFYTISFSELSTFGRLKTRIAELCEKPKDEKEAKNCVDFIKLYVDLSILRQLIMVDMASLMNEPKIQLSVIADNIMSEMRKELESDATLLQFLGDPLNYPSKRLVIAVLFGYPENYEVLHSYLQNFHKVSPVGFWSKSLLLCTDKLLKGECTPVTYGENRPVRIGDLTDINMENVKSFFVPVDGKATLWTEKNYRGKTGGPYIGPALHGFTSDVVFASLKYEKTTETNEGSVRYCEGKDLNPSTLCDYWPIKADATEIELAHYHGIWPWSKKVNSFYIPTQTVLYGINEAGEKQGPFYGPQIVNELCTKSDWVKVSLRKVKWDAREMVQFCDKEDLQGCCFLSYRTLDNLTHVMQKWNFEKKIQSMKIPGALKVKAYKKKALQSPLAGPYAGPVTLNRVDWPLAWKSIEISGQTIEDSQAELEASGQSKKRK